MSTQKKPEYDAYEITEQSVIDYLEQHPDFFKTHQDLLLKLEIPHGSGDAVSILEFQVSRLREQHAEVRKKLIGLVNVARENDRLNERLHHLTLALINTSNIDEIIDTLQAQFKKDFHADYVNVILFRRDDSVNTEHAVMADMDEQVKQQFENFIKANRPLCGRLKQQQLAYLFNDEADNIGSSVLIPLGQHSDIGMLAIGSQDENRFHSSMGTIYLNQMGEIISTAIKRHME